MPNLPSIIDRNISTLNPFRSIAKMQQQMDRLMDNMWNASGAEDLDLFPSTSFVPACNVEETESHYLMSFDVPGVKKEDIKVELRGHTLCVSGERKKEFEQKDKTTYRAEASYGEFLRSFELAEDVKSDQIEAQYENGVLRVAVPKTRASKSETIKIGEGKGGVLWGKNKH
jgi:HSP20 family protein